MHLNYTHNACIQYLVSNFLTWFLACSEKVGPEVSNNWAVTLLSFLRACCDEEAAEPQGEGVD